MQAVRTLGVSSVEGWNKVRDRIDFREKESTLDHGFRVFGQWAFCAWPEHYSGGACGGGHSSYIAPQAGSIGAGGPMLTQGHPPPLPPASQHLPR